MEKENLLDEGEEIIQPVRKHWIIYVGDLFLHSFGILIALLGVGILKMIGIIPNTELITQYGSILFLMFLLLVWTSFFFAWTKNYFDVWYITNQHIIAINQKEIFNREESFMELTRIQDVSFEREGILSNFFGYGKLRVQSAGTEQEFVISKISNVEQTSHLIMSMRDEAQGRGKSVVVGV